MASRSRAAIQTKQEFFDSLDALAESSDDEDQRPPTTLGSTTDKHILSSTLEEKLPSPCLGTIPYQDPSAGANTSAGSLQTLKRKTAPETLNMSKFINPNNAVEDDDSITDSLVPTGTAVFTKNAMNHAAAKREIKSSIPVVGKAKAKRQCIIKLVPQEKQIFGGLTFFFFPNNELDPSRRARIILALEHGAVWLREFHSSVTHIIVDEHITFSEVLKHLNLPHIPVGVAVVLPCWQSDSIEWSLPLEAGRKRYQIQGFSPESCNNHHGAMRDVLLPDFSESNSIAQPQKQETKRASRLERHSPRHQTSPIKLDNSAQVSGPSFELKDQLQQAILESKTLADLPLDSDSDSEGTQSLNLGYQVTHGNTGKGQSSGLTRNVKSSFAQTSPATWQEGFACMHGGTLRKNCVNERTIQILQQMCDYYESIHDTWRPVAYRKAITTLTHHPKLITTKSEAERLPNIGPRLAEKIEEIFWTNKLRRLEMTNLEDSDVALQTFLKIYGVGYLQASKWVQQGFRTIEQLRRNVHLTENQKIGVEHFQDFQRRIPRSEVAELGHYVENALLQLDPRFQLVIGGSYRRGALDSGDVDLIISKPNVSIAEVRTLVLDTLVPQLIEQGFVKVALAETSRESGTKWHGACTLTKNTSEDALHQPWRRIDLLLVPWDEIGAALLYFTGNDIFNRSMRLLARKKRMRLNQRGLYKDVIRGPNNHKLTTGIKMEGEHERRIFEILEVPWREPEDRNC